MKAIHFDTNALIALPLWVRADHPVIERMQQGTPAAACELVWYEFVCGPVSDEHKQLARALLAGRIEPVTEVAAELAGRLYNAIGRMRRTRTDALDRRCGTAPPTRRRKQGRDRPSQSVAMLGLRASVQRSGFRKGSRDRLSSLSQRVRQCRWAPANFWRCRRLLTGCAGDVPKIWGTLASSSAMCRWCRPDGWRIR